MADAEYAAARALFDSGQILATAQRVARWQADSAMTASRWHLAGMVAMASGYLPVAEQALRAALLAAPDNVEAHYQMGRLLKDLGRVAEAIDSYDRALAYVPDYWPAHSSRGTACRLLGRYHEALASQRTLSKLRPNDPAACLNLANALFNVGQPVEAAEAYARTLALRPGDPSASLGLAQTKARALLEAEEWEALLAHVAQTPAALDVPPYLSLAAALARYRLGERDAATERFREALTRAPSDPQQCWALGDLLARTGRCWDEAIPWYERAIALSGAEATVEFHNSLVAARYFSGDLPGAEDACERALAINPEAPEVHFNRGVILLWQDRYAEGFAAYERRFEAMRSPTHPDSPIGRPPLGVQAWQGEDLQGKTLVLWPEQGIGDALQFLRYLPVLCTRTAPVNLKVAVPLSLQTLVQASFPGLNVLNVETLAQAGGPVADFDAPLMSLPHLLGTPEDTQRSAVPYLTPSPAQLARWQARLGARQRLRVGLVWAGNPQHLRDFERSIPLRLLATLASSRIEFHALQKGHGEAQLDELPDFALQRTGAACADFHDTAAALSQLDLLITVDTSVAHLAGAMGVPTWLLLHAYGEWRWGVSRAECRWYPSVRFFRQIVPGEWGEVIERVRHALLAHAAGNER
jgi:tetratricopeptide (TPR) repeat protein